MKSKLKKKTKISDIFFPATFQKTPSNIHHQHQTFDNQRPMETSKQQEQICLSNNYLKMVAPSSKERIQTTQQIQIKRSYSQLSYKSRQHNLSRGDESSLIRQKAKPKQTSKLHISSNKNRAAEIAQIFYSRMEQNLVKECEAILKKQTNQRSLSSCKMERLSPYLYKLHRTIESRPGSISINLKGELSHDLQSQKAFQPMPASVQNSEVGKSELEIIRASEVQKQAHSQVQISYSQEDSQGGSVIHDSVVLKKTSLIVDRKIQVSGESLIITTSSKDSKLLSLIASLQIFMVSSKLLVRSSGFFKVIKIEFSSKDLNELSIFLQFCGKIVFKKITCVQQKKIFDIRSRKNHLKKLQNLKDKLRQKIFFHFSKPDQSKEVMPFCEDLLSFIQQCLNLEHTYLGLVFTDYEQVSLALINQQKLDYLFKGKQSFYFMMKLRGTYYLVKADSNADLKAQFTLVIDFTSLSSGDQLVFPHHTPISHYSLTPSKIYRLLPKVSDDFILNVTQDWGTTTDATQEMCSAKVGKVLVQNLQKWSGTQVDELWSKLWDINKKYVISGQSKNFFEFHSQYDYLFFTKPLKYFRVDDYNYCLNQSCTISLYKHPHHYQQLKTSQIQMQALVIPHLPMGYKQIRRHVVTSFFNHRESKAKSETQAVFKMLMKNFKIELRVKQNLQIYLNSITNNKCFKLTLPLQKSLRIKQLTATDLSSYLQRKIAGYKVRSGQIYSKLAKNQKQHIVMYYKGLHKFEAHFVYVSLYKLVDFNLFEFKVHTFKIGRNFIVRLENAQFTPQTLKQTIATLINYFKTVYFKGLLHEEARKSKKRRKDALQDFLKNQVKANPNNLRAKRKVEEDKRRKMLRLATMKWSESENLIYEEIISHTCHTKKGQFCYFTLRYLPVNQMEMMRVTHEQLIELRVYIAGRIAFFKYQIAVKDIINIVDDKGRFQVTSLRELYLIFKQAEVKLKQIVENCEQTLDFLFLKLKSFVDPNYLKREYSIHPFKFKIIGSSFYQTKIKNHKEKVISTEVSIDLNLERKTSILTEEIGQLYHQGRQIPQIIQEGSKKREKAIYRPFYTFVTDKWLVQVVDFVKQQQEWALMKQTRRRSRQIRIMNRETNRMYLVSQWEGYFLTGLQYHQFNKKMLKRVISAIKVAL